MDRKKLRNFAMYSREKLIEKIEYKIMLMGIREEGIQDPLPGSELNTRVFNTSGAKTYRIYGDNIRKYEELLKELRRREGKTDYKIAYKSLIEEAAYFWFNKIIIIRFMEINKYILGGLRTLSSGRKGIREPEIVRHYRDTSIGITEKEFERLDRLRLNGSVEAMDKIFQFMFLKQYRLLNKNMPELFERINDYLDLLLNISYSDEKGVIYKLIEEIGEIPFNMEKGGRIETIGWLYQYYNTASKVEAGSPRRKVDKNTLPYKTQLFTPEWIVKYMVQNSLGRLWLQRRIVKGSDRTEKELAKSYGWEYYLADGKQSQKLVIELEDVKKSRKDLELRDIRFVDPSMGSGHILIYAFEMFMQFYTEEGYTEDDAAKSIIENNLYGLDIDKKAYQLAYFSLMMKGRQYNLGIFNEKLHNNLYYYMDSRDLNTVKIDVIIEKAERKKAGRDARKHISEIMRIFKNGKELGSIIRIDKKYDYDMLIEFVESINDGDIRNNLIYLLKLAKVLSIKYHIVVTNPPYLGLRKMSSNMKRYAEKNYLPYKYDLFSIFIKRSFDKLLNYGLLGYMTPNVWKYIASYSHLRKYIIDNHGLINFIELHKGSFKEANVDIVTFSAIKGLKYDSSRFIKLNKDSLAWDNKARGNVLENSLLYEKNIKDFMQIPGYNFAYWINNKTVRNFRLGTKLERIGLPRQGMATTDNHSFLKNWYEVDFNNINLLKIDRYMPEYRWYPYNKGGGHRNWYGNNQTIIDWDDNGREIKRLARLKYGVETRTIKNQGFYFKEGITYSFIGRTISARKTGKGFLFDVAGSTIFLNDEEYFEYLLALLYSVVSDHYIGLLNPTINIQVGDIKNIPIILNDIYKAEIDALVEHNVSISKTDWDSLETSWDFSTHPLLDRNKGGKMPSTVQAAYENWKNYTDDNFVILKENEERLNELFIRIYGLEDELVKDVADRDVTITRIFDDKDGNRYCLTKEEVIKSLISYGVGCIFGRYSLDERGLICAGGEFDQNRYNRFNPVDDNVVLITDRGYCKNDLTDRFIEFIRLSFEEEDLERNLKFIADSLGGRGTPEEKIRSYFIDDFYEDHIRRYQRTPIYWLYDSSSGKSKRQGKNGFKALIYMHRYDRNTTERVRIDYLHMVEKIYRDRIDFLRSKIVEGGDPKKVGKWKGELDKRMDQLKECRDYDKDICHVAHSRVSIDLDDGVKINYQKAQTDNEGIRHGILAKI